MLDALLGAAELFASVDNLLAIVIGVAIGVFVGAIPGMTGTLAVALALPFTFYMAPVTAILLLVGIYKGSFYGGSIPAILIRSPGTPAAACTALDGYPLAQQGQAGKALNMALYASCFADVVSNMALFFFAAAIASYALRFGPAEFFALICFALTITAGVSGNSLLRGLVAATLGLLLATIGQDLVYGSPRMAFGEPELMGGLNFIPVLIGLFAIPEIINAVGKRGGTPEIIKSIDRNRVTWLEFRRCLPTITRGSIIGVILGAIPGIGGAPAAFLSYSEAHRTSREPEKFGKGALEGVAAAESGNNGVCGATLIPLLALGIPGDVITAIILGAFMIHGLAPGPQLFANDITLVYAIFMGILLSSAALFVIGKLAISTFGRIADIPRGILLPMVLILCAYGAYGVNNTLFDVLVMLIMGVVGYIMLRLSIPAAPFLIAFILGPMFEDNLRRSLLGSRGSLSVFFESGISIFFLALTALSLVLILRSQMRRARQRAKADETAASSATQP
ncbi:MAG: tripartite tricarboxylate transporter permease [Aquisalimonadaceae bacterium]